MPEPTRNDRGELLCDRCHQVMHGYSMSYFNTDLCCLACLRKEREHPQYEHAREVELKAVMRGDRNFPGIGKPDDL